MIFKCLILWYFILFRWHRWWYGKAIGKLQEKRLRRLFSHLRKVPFYAEIITPQTRIEDLPIVNKQIFMQEFDRMNAVGIRRKDAEKLAFEAEASRDFSQGMDDITVGLSSGTTGNTGIFLVSQKERARWVAAVLDRVIGFSFRKRKVAFFLRANSNLYESARSPILQFQFFDICLPLPPLIEQLAVFQPDIIVAQPSVLREIAHAVAGKQIAVSPAKIISVAEVLYPKDRQYFEKVFGIRIDEVYQCTEGFLAASGPTGKLHFNDDFILVEKKFVDAEKKRFRPIITDMFRYTQPVIRYEMEDIIVPLESGEYNWPGMVIDYIEGRSDDSWIFTGLQGETVQIFPDTIRRAVITASDQITFYVLSQVGADQIDAYLEIKDSACKEEIYKKVRKNINERLKLLGVSPKEIIFMSDFRHEAGSKLRRIRNEHS